MKCWLSKLPWTSRKRRGANLKSPSDGKSPLNNVEKAGLSTEDGPGAPAGATKRARLVLEWLEEQVNRVAPREPELLAEQVRADLRSILVLFEPTSWCLRLSLRLSRA